MKKIVILLLLFLFAGLAGTLFFSLRPLNSNTNSEFDARVNTIAAPYGFNWSAWEVSHLADALGKMWVSSSINVKSEAISQLVRDFFALPFAERSQKFKKEAESIIAKQIEDGLKEEGIFNPFNNLGNIFFPPVLFVSDRCPNVLVISPRDDLQILRKIDIRPDLSKEERRQLKQNIEALGVSAIIAQVGGCASFPTIADQDLSLQDTITLAAHEWTHHYLFFTPLGREYKISNAEMAAVNEAVADIVAQDIGKKVIKKYYPEMDLAPPSSDESQNPAEVDSEWSSEIKKLYGEIKRLIADGKKESIAPLLAERKQYLNSLGYDVEDLNTAYLSWGGLYISSADVPSPIGAEVWGIRNLSTGLKDFLQKMSNLDFTLSQLKEANH